MRKWLVLALIMVLSAVLPVAAHAVDDKLGSVALVVQHDDEVQVVGMAVLVQAKDGETWLAPTSVIQTTDSGKPVKDTYLMTEDGLVAMVLTALPYGNSGISALNCYGQLEPVAAPMATNLGDPESQAIVGYLDDGTLISSGAYNIANCPLEGGLSGMTLTAMEGLMPGSATYDRDGRLTGMVLASLGEGEGRYLAIGAPALNALLSGWTTPVSAPEAEEEQTTKAEDLLTYEFDGGYLTITPEGISTPTEQSMAVYYMDSGNAYYTWLTEEAGAKEIDFTLPAVPGRVMMIWFAYGSDTHGDKEFGELLMTQEPLIIETPAAMPIDRYEYWQECYLSVVPLAKVVGVSERLEPTVGLTSEMLTDSSHKLYFQVNSHYVITENSEESLLVCLYTPDDSCLTDIAGFYWGLEYMEKDEWHMDVTELFTYYAEINDGILPEGIYTLTYYIGSDLAGSYSFTLSDSSLLDGGGET